MNVKNLYISLLLLIATFVSSYGQEDCVSAEEKAVLIDFYNSTDGANWTNNTNWLSDAPVSEWYGVKLNDECEVSRLALEPNNLSGNLPSSLGQISSLSWLYTPNNNLSGTIPNEIINLPNLRGLNLSNNNFTGYIDPALVNAIILIDENDLDGVYLDNNNFVFLDLENLFNSSYDLFTNAIEGQWFVYSPQAKVDQTETLSVAEGGSITLTSTALTSTNNTYQWYKDGVAIGTPTTTKELVIENATQADAGEYYFTATNSIVTDLTLTRNTIILTVEEALDECGISLAERTALWALYQSTDGPNWTNTLAGNKPWSLDTPVCDWYGVQTTGSAYGQIIFSINLNSNNLSGTIPNELADLDYITTISLKNNNLVGGIPAELANFEQSFYALSGIYLDDNQLSGTFPIELINAYGSSSNAMEFYFPGNNFVFNDFSLMPNSSISYFTYHDYQNDLAASPDQTVNENLEVIIPANVKLQHSNNQYQWYKSTDNGVNYIPIDGANSKDYIIASVTLDDAGLYKLEVLNPTYPYLTLNQDPTTITVESTNNDCVSAEERAALVAFYNSTNGDNWTNNTNWLSDAPVSEWYGVTVLSCKVIELQFLNNNLTGNLPPEIGNLVNLTKLQLPQNSIEGTIPEELSNLNNLNSLYLSYNSFEGEIPNELSELTLLQSLILSFNELSGEIPAELGELNSLRYFGLNDNNFSGAVPREFGNLTSLLALSLQNNELSNTIPDTLLDLPVINELIVHSNNFVFNDFSEGFLDYNTFNYQPQSNLTASPNQTISEGDALTIQANGRLLDEDNQYQWLKDGVEIAGDAAKNKDYTISAVALADAGSYSLQITNTTYPNLTLTQEATVITVEESTNNDCVSAEEKAALIALYNSTDGPNWKNNTNWLTDAPVSEWLGVYLNDDCKVKQIVLGNNGLSGDIPSELGELIHLESLLLNQNSLTGNIPAELGNLTKLTHLYLYTNQLTGSIPSSIGNLTNLNRLYLYGNSLSGNIPAELGQLVNVEWLHLAANQLTGDIPFEFSGLSSVQYFNLGGNNLTGGIQNITNLTTITSLYLNANNFTGTLPESISNLSVLSTLNLSDNNFEGILPIGLGEIEGLYNVRLNNNLFSGKIPFNAEVQDGINWLYIYENKFVFDDLNEGFITNDKFTYINQAKLESSPDQIIAEGDALTIQANERLLDEDNQYQWLKDGVEIVGDAAKNKDYTIPAVALADAGSYSLQITNTTYPNLTLTQEATVITVEEAIDTCGVSEEEKQALIDLYNSTDGANWANNTNWLTDAPVCDWYGVTVVNDVVSELALANNNLNGQILESIGNLTGIKELFLQSNSLGSQIPDSLGNLVKLEKLYLNDNNFEGVIPETFGNQLSSLRNLFLHANNLTGTIPLGVTQLSELKYLRLDQNELIGVIPPEISNLENLLWLFLYSNDLSGSIPDEIGDLENVQVIYLNDNNFEGVIPETFGELVNLKTLGLEANNLESKIPEKLSQLSSLVNLKFENNNFVFVDFEAEHEVYISYNSYNYAPQAKVDETETLSVAEGGSITLTSTALTSTNNTYQWYKDGVAIGEPTTTKELVIENATQADAGEYYFTATNSIVTDLTLTRNTITLEVSPCTIPASEKEALEDLFAAANGANWTNTTAGDHVWNDDISVCDWFGLTITDGHVTKIELPTNQLTGSLNPSLNDFPYLVTLNLSDNDIQGDIPSELSGLLRLEEMFLNNNQISGVIPTDFGSLLALQKLYLDNNQLSGGIPPTFCTIENLTELSLANNQLSGDFSSSIRPLNKLEYIDVSNNQLTGTIASSFSALSLLRVFNVSYNQLSGAIPEGFTLRTNLETLKFDHNNFIFSDFEEEHTTYLENIATYTYDPQGKTDTEIEQTVLEGSEYTITTELSSENNDYTWYKDGVPLNEISNTLVFDSIKMEDAGVYTFESVNATIADLKLERNTVTLTVTESCTVSEEDKNKLLSLYNATNGPNWTNTVIGENVWSVDNPVCNWHGVTVVDNKVTEVDLSNNGLEGQLPTDIATIYTLTKLNIAENNLIFADIETASTSLNSLLGTEFIYAPQRIFGSENTMTLTVGDALTLNDNGVLSSATNKYTWYLNGTEIASGDNPEYTVPSVILENAGEYVLKVTNANLPNLTLTQAPITLNIQETNDGGGDDTCGVSEEEKAALWALYESTAGPNWTNTKAGDQPWSLDTPVCDWYGITVVEGKVERVVLQNNNLVGDIPTLLSDLSSITHLYLNINKLTGTIPEELGNLNYLEYLHLSVNELHGNIPVELSNIDSLKYLNLSVNKLEGSIPVEIGNLSLLNSLYLSSNELEGPIPVEIGKLSDLIFLNLSGNNLTGNIPKELVNLTLLQNFVLERNQLSGDIPHEFKDLTLLNYFHFRYNNFVFADFEDEHEYYLENINSYFYNLQAKVDLEETKNIIAGNTITLTSEALSSTNNTYQWYKDGVAIGEPTATKDIILENVTEADAGVYHFTATNSIVTDLTLERNPITVSVIQAGACEVTDAERQALIDFYYNTDGANWTNTKADNKVWEITNPESDICNWYGIEIGTDGSIKGLNLSNNNLRGEIPVSISNLENLQVLDLDENSLSGVVPESIGNFFYLKTLNLSNNNFVSEIPSSIVNLPSIEYIYLNDNFFKGSLPSDIGNLVGLIKFDASRNKLSGAIPESMYTLVNLEVLKLTENSFSGGISDSIINLESLVDFWVSSNRLSGDFTPNMAIDSYLTNLTTFHIDHNYFGGDLPLIFEDFTKEGLSLKIEDNQFVFNDFEADYDTYIDNLGVANFTYDPQDLVDTTYTTYVEIGDVVTLTSNELTSNQNNYTWYKYESGAWQPITGANTKEYSFTVTSLDDLGQYRFTATNDTIDNLTLTRRAITVAEKIEQPIETIEVTVEGPTGTTTKVTIDVETGVTNTTTIQGTPTGGTTITIPGTNGEPTTVVITETEITITDGTGTTTTPIDTNGTTTVNPTEGVTITTDTTGGTQIEITNPTTGEVITISVEPDGGITTNVPDTPIENTNSDCTQFPYTTLADLPIPNNGSSVDWFEFDYTSDTMENFSFPSHLSLQEFEILINTQPIDFTNEQTRNQFILPKSNLVYPDQVFWGAIDGDYDVLVSFGLPSAPDLPILPEYNYENESGFEVDESGISYKQIFFIRDNPTVANLQAEVGADADGSVVTWHSSVSSEEVLSASTPLVDGQEYYAALNGSFCRLKVPVEVAIPPVTLNNSQIFCAAKVNTLQDIVVDNQDAQSELIWYASSTGGVPLNANTQLVHGATYYVSQKDQVAESKTRNSVTITLENAPSFQQTSGSQTIYLDYIGQKPTVSMLQAPGSYLRWYNEAGNQLQGSDEIFSGTYFATQRVSNTSECESGARYVLTVSIEEPLPEKIIICEKFRPQPGEEYVFSGWVKQNGYNITNNQTQNLIGSPEADLFVEFLNSLLTDFVFNTEKPTSKFVPPVYVPSPLGDDRKYDPLKDFVENSTSDRFTIYDFKYNQEPQIEGFKRTVGFQFSFSPNKATPDFVYQTYKISSIFDPMNDDDRYPLVKIIDDRVEMSLSFNGLKTASNGSPSVETFFRYQLDAKTHTVTQSIDIEGIKLAKETFDKELIPNYQEENYTASFIDISYQDELGTQLPTNGIVTFTPSGTVIDGWQRVYASFRVPMDAYTMKIALRNNSEAGVNSYFDDIRIHPYNSNLKSFVYDPVTQRLQAELDENNYATFYEYDKEGGLIRVKKETERGVYTIQETRSGNSKLNSNTQSSISNENE